MKAVADKQSSADVDLPTHPSRINPANTSITRYF